MSDTTEILIHITLGRKTKKFIVIDSSADQEKKNRKMRKRKNEKSVDEINQLQKKRTVSCSTDRSKTQNKNKSKGRN